MSKAVKILLVEDDLDLCQGWGEIFELLGYEHVAHQRGLRALEDEAAIASSDLIVTDYYLPDINGADLIKRLRERRPDLPAILLTGSRELSVVKAVEQIGDCELLHKPLNIDDLEKKIERMIAR